MTVIPSGTSYFLPAISTVTIFGRRTSSWSMAMFLSKPLKSMAGFQRTAGRITRPAALLYYILLCNRVHDRIQGWAWTHGFSRLLLIGMIVAAHIDRFSLGAEQLGRNLGLIVCKLFGDFGKTRLKVLIFGLLSQGLRPVQRKIKMAPAIINLTHLSSRRLVALQELGVGSIERIRQNLCGGIVGCFAQMLQGCGQRQEFAQRIPAQIPFVLKLMH